MLHLTGADLMRPESSSHKGPQLFDAIVVGGSFAGLAAALQLALARRQVLLLDAGKHRSRFARHSHGFLGQDGRRQGDILNDARKQLLVYPTVHFQVTEAHKALREQNGFRVVFGEKEEAYARRLILATGVIDRLPDIAGLADRWGEGVLNCPYCDAYEVAGRRLGVLATDNISVHQAELLPDWSDDVTFFTNGIGFFSMEQFTALRSRGVKVVESRVVAIQGKDRSIESVTLSDGQKVPVDALFLITKTSLASPLAEQLGCELEEGQFGPSITTDAWKETTVKGVYAAGDAARRFHNATLAAADGVLAGIAAHQSLIVPATSSSRSG
jgi:thioredoxin reductase